jgi:AraC-like DNA-binding protein
MHLVAVDISYSDMPPSPTPEFDPYGIHDRLHVRLLALRQVMLTPDLWTFDDMRGGFWRLYVNANPGAMIQSGQTTYHIAPNQAFVVPAWVPITSRLQGQVDHLYMHFDLVGLSGPIVRQWFTTPIMLAGDGLIDLLAGRLRQFLLAGRHDEIATAFVAKSLIGLAVMNIFELLEQKTGEGISEGRLLLHRLTELAPVLPALRRIEMNHSEPASNADLADLCGMSEDYFIRVFRQCVGQTPARYALERRVTHAAERLVFGDDSLKLIAHAAGFTNRFHFTRVFTRIIGVSPAQYRRRGNV